MGIHILSTSDNIEHEPSWLLGEDTHRRHWLQRMLLAYALFGSLDLLRGLGVLHERVPFDDWALVAGYDFTWMGLCYALVRSGMTADFKDPAMTLAQVWMALGSILLAFALIDVGRLAMIPLWCATLVLGLYQMPPRHLAVAGGLTLMVMGLLTWLMSWLTTGFAAAPVVTALMAAAISLPVLAGMARHVQHFQADDAQHRHELQEAMTQLQALSTQDALTGLASHRHMLERLSAECKRHARGGRPFCIAMLDIDHLHEVNETQGRDQGDEVLRQFGTLSKAHLRVSDVMARWGGEEFLLLMPDTDLDGGKRSLERLREYLYARWGYYDKGRWAPMNCSAGVTLYRTGEDIRHTLARAEDALRAAKTLQHDRSVAA
jgi:diguanylate cyclase (GGDEF)-like protein